MGLFRRASCGLAMCTFFSTLIAYFVVHQLDFLITEKWMKKEMCIKIYSWEASDMPGTPSDWGSWTFRYDNKHYHLDIFDRVCFFRLLGLIVVTWFTVWFVYAYSRFKQVQAEKVTRYTETEFIGGAGGGGG